MVKTVEIGKESSVDRAVRDLPQFTEWTTEAIESQQDMLTDLAKVVWEMP
jgi:hypothetical protein